MAGIQRAGNDRFGCLARRVGMVRAGEDPFDEWFGNPYAKFLQITKFLLGVFGIADGHSPSIARSWLLGAALRGISARIQAAGVGVGGGAVLVPYLVAVEVTHSLRRTGVVPRSVGAGRGRWGSGGFPVLDG